jgi:TolB-like protein/Flp pilus assembly protein TadD
MTLFQELKRRNVIRVGLAYVVGGWVLLQIIDFVLDAISAPNWIVQVFILVAVVGLPVVLTIAWVFEMTPEGVKRQSEIDRGASITSTTGRKLDRVIISFLALAVVLLLADRFLYQEEPGSGQGLASTAAVAQSPSDPELTEPPDGEGTDSAEKSIAVLPFVNMSSDPEQEYFSDGLAEELLNRLAKNGNLRVAARTSAFQFKGKNLDVADIGRQLNVDHVLEGSVRKSGLRLRITAQLINVDDGFHLWSETYEREMDDIFAIQDEISLAITHALEVELGADNSDTDTKPTDNLDAYSLYLRGRYFLAARGSENMSQADELFHQATSLDPHFAAAWGVMAFNQALLVSYSSTVSPLEQHEAALKSAARALELNPQSAEAYSAIGYAEAFIGRNWSAAKTAMDRAYELEPNNVSVVNLYGDYLIMMGDFERSELIESRAVELDPLAAVHQTDLSNVFMRSGRLEKALEPARVSINLAPDSIHRADPMVTILTRLGRFDEAGSLIREIIQDLDADSSEPDLVTFWWSYHYYSRGDRDGLREYLDHRLSTVHSGPSGSKYDTIGIPFSWVGFFTLALDGAQAALPWLEKGYANHEEKLIWPDFFYLPERMSSEPEWLEFWNQPDLRELMDIRRANGPYGHIGLWNDSTQP